MKLTRELRLCEQPRPKGAGCCRDSRLATPTTILQRRPSVRSDASLEQVKPLRFGDTLLARLEHPFIVSYFGHEFVMGAQGGQLLRCPSCMSRVVASTQSKVLKNCTSSWSTAVVEAWQRTPCQLWKAFDSALPEPVCQAAPHVRPRQ